MAVPPLINMRPAASGPPLFEVTTKNDRAARRYELQSDFAFKRRRLPGGQSGMQPFHDIFVNLTLFFAAKTDIIGYAWKPETVAKQVAQIAKDEFVHARRSMEACRDTLTDANDAAGLSGRRVQEWIQASKMRWLFRERSLECVSKCREMQFQVDLPAFQGNFPQA